MTGSELHVTQRNTGIERRHDERATKHVRVDMSETCSFADRSDPPVRGAPIESGTATSNPDWSIAPFADGQVKCAGGPRDEWDYGWFVALADDPQCPVAAVESKFKDFLTKIDAAVPEHLDVHVVMDNSSTHKTPAIHRWQLTHPRFHFHFTPTSSSWLNLVERWFAELTRRLLRRGTHHSVTALERDLRAWTATWNENPRPFIWHKTADEILESLARYLTRTSESGH